MSEYCGVSRVSKYETTEPYEFYGVDLILARAELKQYAKLSRKWNKLTDAAIAYFYAGRKIPHAKLIARANEIEKEINHILLRYDYAK